MLSVLRLPPRSDAVAERPWPRPSTCAQAADARTRRSLRRRRRICANVPAHCSYVLAHARCAATKICQFRFPSVGTPSASQGFAVCRVAHLCSLTRCFVLLVRRCSGTLGLNRRCSARWRTHMRVCVRQHRPRRSQAKRSNATPSCHCLGSQCVTSRSAAPGLSWLAVLAATVGARSPRKNAMAVTACSRQLRAHSGLRFASTARHCVQCTFDGATRRREHRWQVVRAAARGCIQTPQPANSLHGPVALVVSLHP